MVTVIGLYLSNRQARKAQADDFLWRLVEKWESEEMRACRMRAASDFLHHRKVSRNTIEIYNFLELIGFFVRSGTVPDDGAWVYFSTFVWGYWGAGRVMIALQQIDDPTVFQELDILVKRLTKFEVRRRHISEEQTKWNDEEVELFLKNEMELIPPPEPAKWRRWVSRAVRLLCR